MFRWSQPAWVETRSLLRIGKTGLLVPPDNVDKLAEALELFLTQPQLRAECARRARNQAIADYGLAQSCRRYEHLYETLILEKSHRSASRHTRVGLNEGAKPIRVAIVAASTRQIGGHSTQAELMIRNWRNDPEVSASFIPIDPEFPRALAWAERIPLLRTILRTPLYLKGSLARPTRC